MPVKATVQSVFALCSGCSYSGCYTVFSMVGAQKVRFVGVELVDVELTNYSTMFLGNVPEQCSVNRSVRSG